MMWSSSDGEAGGRVRFFAYNSSSGLTLALRTRKRGIYSRIDHLTEVVFLYRPIPAHVTQ